MLLVILKADPSRGGAERYTVDLAQGLSRRGHRVTIAATEFAGTGDIPQVELRTPGMTKIGRYEQFLRSLERIWRRILMTSFTRCCRCGGAMCITRTRGSRPRRW